MMLSYMVPSIEEKPPPVPKPVRFQLDLENPRLTNGHAIVNGTDMLVTTPSLPADTGATVVKPDRLRTVPVPEGVKVNGSKINGTGGSKGVKGSALSTESSASSLSSGVGEVAGTHLLEKPKPKLISNGGTKHQSLKRVSFGSSKGSMVETLIYESPVQEEPEVSPTPDSADTESETKQPSIFRVIIFDQKKPLVVNSPEPEATEDLDGAFLNMTASPVPDPAAPYHRQTR